MLIHLTRDSVCAGDDLDAPHEKRISLPEAASIEQAIEMIVASDYLAKVQGDATWSAVSGFPIAVVAQQWSKPRAVSWCAIDTSALQVRDGVIGLHFNYHAQIDPELVHAVLTRLKLNAF